MIDMECACRVGFSDIPQNMKCSQCMLRRSLRELQAHLAHALAEDDVPASVFQGTLSRTQGLWNGFGLSAKMMLRRDALNDDA